jgi:type IV pilus assembly protein PilE
MDPAAAERECAMTPRRKAGFTLVEIMITVAIVGLLAMIAIPSFMNARVSSMRNTCISHLRQMHGAKTQYALFNNGAAPPDVAAMVPSILRNEPVCPAGGTYTLGDINEDPVCSEAALGHSI